MTPLERLRLKIGLWIMPTWASRIIYQGLRARDMLEEAIFGDTK